MLEPSYVWYVAKNMTVHGVYIAAVQSFVPAAGVYPEIKSPAWHNALPEVLANKTSIEDIVLAVGAMGFAFSAGV